MAKKNPILDLAIAALNKRKRLYKKYRDYYDGEHSLAFATEKFDNAFGKLFSAFADNLCPSVVDTLVDRLRVDGFGFVDGSTVPDATQEDILAEVDAIWAANRMERRAGEVHNEAALTGDAYVIVWPDPDDPSKPIIYPNKADKMTVSYSEDNPGEIEWAAKRWVLPDKRTRVNLYYPDRIEKYVSAPDAFATAVNAMQVTPGFPGSELPQNNVPSIPVDPGMAFGSDVSTTYSVWKGDGDSGVVKNPYGKVPVFHLPNNAPLGDFGRSELKNAIPLQDALNKSIADMLVAMEFVALPQRWATGVDVIIDQETGKPIPPFVPGVDRLWTLGKTDANFGQFEGANLTQFINVSDGFRLEVARVTNTPVHYLMLQPGNFPSGESLKTAETPFTAKCSDRTLTYGEFWAAVMEFCLLITRPGVKGIQLETQWKPVAPTSQTDTANFLSVMKDIKDPVLLKRAGFTEDEIDEMTLTGSDMGPALMSAFTNGSAPLPGRASATPPPATAPTNPQAPQAPVSGNGANDTSQAPNGPTRPLQPVSGGRR